MHSLEQPASDVKLPDRVRAARLLDSAGQVLIVRSARPRKDGRRTFEARAVITSSDRALLEWLRNLWGGWAFNPRWASPQSWYWLVKSRREATDFLRVVRPFASVQKPWIESTLEFLDFQGSQPPRRRLSTEAYLQQVSMHERQQALRNLKAGKAPLRVLPDPELLEDADRGAS